jgi:hypothetical protein
MFHFLTLMKGRAKKNGATGTISSGTLRQYASAIKDLYCLQKDLGANSNPDPRDSAVKALLKSYRSEEEDRRKAEYVDRGRGTVRDGFTDIDQLKSVILYLMQQNSIYGHRNRLISLASHACCFRGETLRDMDLADVFCLTLPDQGYSRCLALFFCTRQGYPPIFKQSSYLLFREDEHVQKDPIRNRIAP